MPQLISVWASASRLQWLWPAGHRPACLNPFCEARLLDADMATNSTKARWNAGRFAPVTLRLELDAAAASMALCPHMVPDTGEVAVVLVDEETGARCASVETWRDKVWVALPLPRATRRVRIEFVTSPSWIAVRAVRFHARAIPAEKKALCD